MSTPPIEVRARRDQFLGMPPASFLHDYWQKRPLLIRQAFSDFTPPLQPDDLAGLACMDGVLARIVLRKALSDSPIRGRAKRGSRIASTGTRTPTAASGVVAKGGADNPSLVFQGELDSETRLRRDPDGEQWEVRTGPFNDDVFATLPDADWTLLVQDVDKWDADTAAVLDAFAFIPNWRIDDVMISYAADRGGVGAHVDQYDVFLLQGLGQRRWAIDARPDPPTAFRDDVELKLLREFEPTHGWTLDRGDMLYLPPGVPHDGVALGECMTFSVGMRAPATSELLLDFTHHLAEMLPESERYSDPDLVPATSAGEIDDTALQRARRSLGSIAANLDDDAFADWFGSFVTRYRCAQSAVPRKRRIDREGLAKLLPGSILKRDPWSRFAWRRKVRGARLYVAGVALDAPVAWARKLASGAHTLDGAQLAKLPQAARGIVLLSTLINGGHVTYRRR